MKKVCLFAAILLAVLSGIVALGLADSYLLWFITVIVAAFVFGLLFVLVLRWLNDK